MYHLLVSGSLISHKGLIAILGGVYGLLLSQGVLPRKPKDPQKIYLPMFAAVVGFTVPLVCIRRLGSSSWRVTGWVFAGYLAVMLIWGIIDIRQQHYQIGGHDYPNGVLVDGQAHYWHIYFTWYFIPYRWVEQGIAP